MSALRAARALLPALTLSLLLGCQDSRRVPPPPEASQGDGPSPRTEPQGSPQAAGRGPDGEAVVPSKPPVPGEDGPPPGATPPGATPPASPASQAPGAQGAVAGATAGTAAAAQAGGGTGAAPQAGGARVFDHRHTDIDRIPAKCIQALTSSPNVIHYGHRSHGAQILAGAKALKASKPALNLAVGYASVPHDTNALRMWDGMLKDNAVKAENYWATDAAVADLRTLLKGHPEIRTSMWAWSYEIAQQSQEQIQRYLTTLSALEKEFPKVTFVYMTGPGDDTYNGKNRAERNQQIRDYCQANHKVLYDFEDLDVWGDGKRHTATADGAVIPMQHPKFSVKTPGNTDYQWTHATQESSETKARAFWWMMAKLNGCELP
ncbi:hypothetical protein [Chondromyces apiculatus]|nr:hypothetical protein [Chondromyces apiculatus]